MLDAPVTDKSSNDQTDVSKLVSFLSDIRPPTLYTNTFYKHRYYNVQYMHCALLILHILCIQHIHYYVYMYRYTQ